MSNDGTANSSRDATDQRLALVLAELETSDVGGGGRAAPLFVWLWERRVQLRVLLQSRRPDWAALARGMARAGLADAEGQPPTAALCRQAWLRVMARERALGIDNETGVQAYSGHGTNEGRPVPFGSELMPPPSLPFEGEVREVRAREVERASQNRSPRVGHAEQTRKLWVQTIAASGRRSPLSDPSPLSFPEIDQMRRRTPHQEK